MQYITSACLKSWLKPWVQELLSRQPHHTIAAHPILSTYHRVCKIIICKVTSNWSHWTNVAPSAEQCTFSVKCRSWKLSQSETDMLISTSACYLSPYEVSRQLKRCCGKSHRSLQTCSSTFSLAPEHLWITVITPQPCRSPWHLE